MGHSYGRKFQLEVSGRFPGQQKGRAISLRRRNLNPRVRRGCQRGPFVPPGPPADLLNLETTRLLPRESLSPGTRQIGLAILSSSAEQVGVARL